MQFEIIGCPEWGAVPPHRGFESIVWTPGPAKRVIIHGTAGHHPEVSNPRNESPFESTLFVRNIQHFHMSPSASDSSKPWNDSGQNFTVCRNGLIYQGRWRTIRAIQHGRMVVSAHCPSQNDQVGIEFEHLGSEEMTPIQKEAGGWLQAWIASNYDKKRSLPADPHKKYVNTSCPVNLVDDIEIMRQIADHYLARGAV